MDGPRLNSYSVNLCSLYNPWCGSTLNAIRKRSPCLRKNLEKKATSFHVSLQNHFEPTGSHAYWEDITNVKIHESNEVLADVRDLDPTDAKSWFVFPRNVLPKKGRLPTNNFVVSTSPKNVRRWSAKIRKHVQIAHGFSNWKFGGFHKKYSQQAKSTSVLSMVRGRDVEPPGFAGAPHIAGPGVLLNDQTRMRPWNGSVAFLS